MRRIAFPFPVGNKPWAALAVLFLGVMFAANNVAASTRPKYGGILRVHINERITTVDPRQWPSFPAPITAVERLESLVFDRMVRFDEHGTPRPALAISWQNDAQSKRWQFRLSDNVKFSDGSRLTPE